MANDTMVTYNLYVTLMYAVIGMMSFLHIWILGQSGSWLVSHVYTHSLLFRLAKQYASLNRYTLCSSRKLLFQEAFYMGVCVAQMTMAVNAVQNVTCLF